MREENIKAVCTTEEARQYFISKGLTYDDITEGDILALVMLLNKHIKVANKNGETSVDTISLSKKIDMRKKTNGTILACYLYLNSHYFTRRECISFNYDGFIGFAGWADQGNTNPILRAFLEWCDYLAESAAVQREVCRVIKDMRFLNKAIMKQQGDIKELFTLIMNNPDLPIVAWVDSDIVADDGHNRWIASIGSSHIIEYITVEMYQEYPEMVYKDDTEYYEEFLYDTTEMTEEEITEHINNIDWIKAIAVNIDLP